MKSNCNRLIKSKMHILLHLYMKKLYLTFNNKTYFHNDGVAMSSPLSQVLANVFMVEFETTLITILSTKLSSWRRFVDESYCFAEKTSPNLLYKHGKAL